MQSQKYDSSKVAQETAYKLLQVIIFSNFEKIFKISLAKRLNKTKQTAGEKANDLRYKIIENYCIMHSGEKSHVEKALENFLQLENIYVYFIYHKINFSCLII